MRVMREFPKIRGTLFRVPYNKDPLLFRVLYTVPVFSETPMKDLGLGFRASS